MTVAGGLGSPLGDVPIFVAVVNPGTPAVEQLKVYIYYIYTKLHVRMRELLIWF